MEFSLFDQMSQRAFSTVLNWILGGAGTFGLLLSRRAIKRMPLSVLFHRTNLVNQDATPALVAPSSSENMKKSEDNNQAPSNPVLFVGLLDGLALCRLHEIFCNTFPKERLEVISSQRLENSNRALLSVGGVNDNQVTAHIIVTLLQRRGIIIRHSMKRALILGQTFKVDISPGGLDNDYGVIIFFRNSALSKSGCCLLLGLHAAGTYAAIKILEDPVRHSLFERMLNRSKWYISLRLLLDHFGVKRFHELERDWVIVVKCGRSPGIYPTEPQIAFVDEIPPIESATRGWTREVRAMFWDGLSEAAGWVGVAGDEPVLSTKLVLNFISRFNFEGETILDFGCGPGRLFEGYLKNGDPKKILAMDMSRSMLDRAEVHFRSLISPRSEARKSEFHVIHGDDQDLTKMASESVDTVVCWTILNHIIDNKDCERILKNLCRIAKKRIIVCDPVCKDGQEEQISDDFPTKRRPSSFYSSIILNEGFNVKTKIERFGSPGHPEADRATFIATKDN